jgi:adenylylsulfate kinase
MESHKRSIVKTITWRLIAITVTILISYIWLREWGSSIALSLVANGIKFLLYYLHERGWNRIGFGRKKEIPEDYTI